MTNKALAEKPLPLGTRAYKKHRKILSKWAGKLKVSKAEVNRKALEFFDTKFNPF